MQPGLESLSLSQLKAMDKGVTPMQNILCLKWSSYYRVAVSWNILLGFPGETNEDYRRQIDLLPSLFHLQAREATGKFWLQRFSPYFTRRMNMGCGLRGRGWPMSMCMMRRALICSRSPMISSMSWITGRWIRISIKNWSVWWRMAATGARSEMFCITPSLWITSRSTTGGILRLRPAAVRLTAAGIIEACNEAASRINSSNAGA